MHKHDGKKTHITIERISVTTIRTGSAPQKIYCDICRELITASAETVGPVLLKAQTKRVEKINEVEQTTIDTNEENTK